MVTGYRLSIGWIVRGYSLAVVIVILVRGYRLVAEVVLTSGDLEASNARARANA